jgi:hypothetical protein
VSRVGYYSYTNRSVQGKKTKLLRNNLIVNLKKRIENIDSLIEVWRKKKIVFALALLPYGTIWEAYAHCTHLQIAPANTQTKICKRVQFCQRSKNNEFHR